MQSEQREQELTAIRAKLKELLVSNLNMEGVTPDQIKDDDALFGEGLGLDSLDAVEIIVVVEKTYRVRIDTQETGRKVIRSINTLAQFIRQRTEQELPSK